MTKTIFVLIINISLISGCAPFFSAINYSPSSKLIEISFSEEAANADYKFYYSDTLNNNYLSKLRHEYELDMITSIKTNEIDKIRAILHWTNSQWEHNGFNTPSKSDALTILEEAKEGRQFRCVEYGIVASAGLNAIGIPSRVLSLKTRDVQKVKRGAGHVVTEAFSTQYDKWIFIDPQYDVMPTVNGVPLNAVEFQKAILYERESIELVNEDGVVAEDFSESYISWIGKYLFYFDVLFDQRVDYEINYKTFEGKKKLMLVPLKADYPKIFQRKNHIDYCIYTNAINDFYRDPRN